MQEEEDVDSIKWRTEPTGQVRREKSFSSRKGNEN